MIHVRCLKPLKYDTSIIEFQVQYFESDGDFTPWEGFEPDFIIQKEVYGQMDTCLIIGLKPVTEYYSRVQVWNSAGRGPKGEWRRSETRHARKYDSSIHYLNLLSNVKMTINVCIITYEGCPIKSYSYKTRKQYGLLQSNFTCKLFHYFCITMQMFQEK